MITVETKIKIFLLYRDKKIIDADHSIEEREYIFSLRKRYSIPVSNYTTNYLCKNNYRKYLMIKKELDIIIYNELKKELRLEKIKLLKK